jgi:PAS domain S-box-containing protein
MITAFRQWVKVFNDRTVLVLIGLLFIGGTVMVWHVDRLQSDLMETMALTNADLYTQALAEFRTLYTSDVVERVRGQGIKVTHDFEKDKKAIPLPATLSMKLGQSIGAHRKGAETRLYSAYPFPWRKEQGGLQDDFGREAWGFLTQNPQQSFFRFEQFKGRPSLRYATADLMRASCVDCHNQHPDTPKNDWKENDVRGVLEIIHPMDIIVAAAEIGTSETFGLMAVLGLLSFGGLALVINKVRRTSWILEQRVEERTEELWKSNLELKKEMYERREAEAELARVSRQNNLILNSAGEGIYGLDLDGRTTFANPAAAKMLGYETQELFGVPMHATMHHTKIDGSPYPREECPMYAAFKDGTIRHVENEVLWRKDGTSFPIEYTSTPIRDEGNNLLGAVVTFRDITERKQTELALQQNETRFRQMQKMEAIGTLAGDIAHDFNNILWVILGNTQRSLQKLGNEGPIKSILKEVLTAAQRAKGLVEQILTFGRQKETELQPLNLELVTKEVLKLLRATVPTTVEFRLDIKPDCGAILGDPSLLHQIMMNLCTNAYQAMGETGVLGVSLSPVFIGSRSEAYISGMKPGPYVLLTLSDTGSGMDPQILERIYDPFFTTKEVGKGTGLGLSIVHSNVTLMGGFIKVYSEIEKGTTFQVYFPRIDAPIPVESSQAELAEDSTHGEEILLVDDDQQVLSMLQGMLEDLGYGATVCEDGEKALEIFRGNPTRFSLVITDQTMPNKTGIELAQAIHQIQPDLPIILATGFSSLVGDKNYQEFGIAAYLRKPVDFGELKRTVQDTLNKHRRETYAANTHNGG